MAGGRKASRLSGTDIIVPTGAKERIIAGPSCRIIIFLSGAFLSSAALAIDGKS